MIIILIFYFFIILSSILFYILYVDTLSFYLLLTVIMLPIITLITLIISKRKVKLGLICTNPSCYCGETTPVILRIENRSLLTVSCVKLKIEYKNLLGGETQKMTINTPVFSNNRQEICLRISTECCGTIEVSLQKARIYDMLRIFSLKIKCSNEKVTFMVCPKVYPIEPQVALYQNAEISEDTFSKRSPGDDPSEIFQLHEYHPGDKINRIHWKASVKQDELMVKDYSLPISNCIAFLLCNGADDNEPIETNTSIMNIAASLSVALCESETHHTFIWHSNGQDMNATVTDIESYLKFLSSRLSSPLEHGSSIAPLNSYLYSCETGQAPHYSHLIILTAKCSDELIALLASAYEQMRITVICCDKADGDIVQELPAVNSELEIMHIESEEAISALADMII